ncbi:2,3-bisphosphoglycerate-independent phosphoglycerate mutase [Patescibacteria group bacterium]|nr:2,3-bisphosphoglycerate-independent phosphoglycerate mutase [Patescibacteria group bacterium]
MRSAKPIILLILDGWGIAPKNRGNAIELARKPHFDKLWDKFPHTLLKSHGNFVGLPDDQVGNSEAGHMIIGAGRRIEQDSYRISKSIKDGLFRKNLALLETIEYVKKNNSDLHLMGLVSRGDSPHSSLEHLYELVNLAHEKKVKNIFLHLFTDGRDAPQFSSLKIVDEIFKNIDGKAKLVSLVGRFYAMDRAKNWERTEAAYDCLTSNIGACYSGYRDAIMHAYNQKTTDEFLQPTIICKDKKHGRLSRVKDNDAMIFFNLRSDRARQLTKCFVQKQFNKLNKNAFRRKKVLENFKFCAFTDFGPDLDSILTAFPGADIKNTLPMLLRDKKQVYIAETEKYAHMTYFINGGYADPVNGEDRIRIPSLKIKSYDEKPEMSVKKIVKKVLALIDSEKYNFLAINFANPDMVGHTGNLSAAIKAIECVDHCMCAIVRAALKKKGMAIVTADHGNAEKMIDLETNEIWTEHTTNPVPFILANPEMIGVRLRKGTICDIAPTIYKLFNFRKIPKAINKNLIK